VGLERRGVVVRGGEHVRAAPVAREQQRARRRSLEVAHDLRQRLTEVLVRGRAVAHVHAHGLTHPHALTQREQALDEVLRWLDAPKLTLEELTGGTFSISNGGVFGSMLSTPIINPPQSAILGVHATKDRAVVENGQIVVRPINYLALSYDHRIIDGREAVLFLVSIKEALEDPARQILEI